MTSRALLSILFLIGCSDGNPSSIDTEDSDTSSDTTDSPPPNTGTGIPDDTDLPTEPTDSGETDVDPCDVDGDGISGCTQEDCDDNDSNVYPGAPEICDGKDSNCDGDTRWEDTVGGVLECAACDAGGYFTDAVITTTGSELFGSLQNNIDSITCDYGDARDHMYTTMDNVNGQVQCVYTGEWVSFTGTRPPAEQMNTEHTWPQGDGATGQKKCDLHALYPTVSQTNNARASHPFGLVSFSDCSSSDGCRGGSDRGDNTSGDLVFEPRDEHKGNVARAMLYFAMKWGSSMSNGDYDKHVHLSLYQSWHASDPVDDTEVARTLSIEGYQGNTNPLVLCPFTVSEITWPTSP